MVGVTYFSLSVLLVAWLSALGYVPHGAPWTAPSLYVAIGLTVACVWLLRREFRRDLHQLCVFWVFFGFIVTIGSVLLMFEHRVLGAAFVGASVLSWGAAVVVLVKSIFAKDPRPTELMRRFGEDPLYEHAGVQLALDVVDTTQIHQDGFELHVFLQNCWDRERSVTVNIHPRRGFLGFPGGAEIAHATDPFVLQGEEFGVLSIPVQVTHSGRVALQISLQTSGLGGKRLWRRRVKTIPLSISPRLTLLLGLLTLGTFWAWGGGLYIRVPQGPRVQRNLTLGSQRWRPLGTA